MATSASIRYDAMGQMTHAPDHTADSHADSASEGAASSAPWRDLIWLALLRLGVSAGVGLYGVVALSDDDYARVTIAQSFAARPRLDPSGSSWLPFPFWVMGGVMKLLDSSLDVARTITALEAVAATWILFAAGRRWGFSEKRALVFAALATVTPSVALLGSVTVPELPTAALALFAVAAATAPPRPTTADRAPLLAGAAIFGATLSRYEAWPVAVAISVILWKRRGGERPWKRAAWAALPLLGPAFWIVHNRVAHGDAIAFVRRVSNYRAALGQGASSAPFTYLLGLIAGSPAVMLALSLLVVAALRSSDRAASVANLARFRAWAYTAALLLVFLLAGQLAGGAPTHHPERALLLVWLFALFAVVDLAQFVRPRAWLAVPVLLLLALDYRSTFGDGGVRRDMEERAGQQLRALVPRGERVYAATTDYGYFAIMAAFGRPHDVVVDSQDPRVKRTTLLRDPWNAVVRMRAENASWLVAPSSVVFPLALQERMRDGPLVIYELKQRP
jgi:hypothetical protein